LYTAKWLVLIPLLFLLVELFLGPLLAQYYYENDDCCCDCNCIKDAQSCCFDLCESSCFSKWKENAKKNFEDFVQGLKEFD